MAGVAGQIELRAGGALKERAQFNVVSEVPVPRNQVSKSEHGGRGSFHEVGLALQTGRFEIPKRDIPRIGGNGVSGRLAKKSPLKKYY